MKMERAGVGERKGDTPSAQPMQWFIPFLKGLSVPCVSVRYVRLTLYVDSDCFVYQELIYCF